MEKTDKGDRHLDLSGKTLNTDISTHHAVLDTFEINMQFQSGDDLRSLKSIVKMLRKTNEVYCLYWLHRALCGETERKHLW